MYNIQKMRIQSRDEQQLGAELLFSLDIKSFLLIDVNENELEFGVKITHSKNDWLAYLLPIERQATERVHIDDVIFIANDIIQSTITQFCYL